MSKTVITSSKAKVQNPGKNQVYVNSRGGAQTEQAMTKQASNKHANPAFFKQQADRKNMDQSPYQVKEFYRGNNV